MNHQQHVEHTYQPTYKYNSLWHRQADTPLTNRYNEQLILWFRQLQLQDIISSCTIAVVDTQQQYWSMKELHI